MLDPLSYPGFTLFSRRKNRRPGHFFALTLLVCIILSSCQSHTQPDPLPPGPEVDQPYNVLVLNSYNIGFPWSEDITDGIEQAFDNCDIRPEIFVEYMDTKRYPPEDIFPSLVPMYNSKYENTPIDVIIAVDNNALSFVATYYDEIFPDIPLIFVGVNDFKPEMLGGIKEATGIIENPDPRETIDLILELLPETETLAIVSDGTITGKIHQEQTQHIKSDYQGQLDFEELFDLPIEDLRTELTQLPPNSAVLFLSYFRTSEGESLTVDEALRLIGENTTAPIFTLWDFLNTGYALGGAMLTGKSQGIAAGNIANEVLSGTPASRIPVVESSPTEILLYHPQLQRYNIPAANIPENSTILDQPRNIYREYKTFINIGILLVVTQFIVILNLIIANRQRRAAESELASAEHRLDRILQTIIDGVIEIDNEFHLSYANTTVREILGIPSSLAYGEFVPHPAWVFVDENDEPIQPMESPLNRALYLRKETDHEVLKMVWEDGTIKWIMISASPIMNEEGEVISAIASMTDITSYQIAIQALQKSEKRFRTLFNQVIDAIFLCELDGQIIDVNPQASKLLGFSRNEFLERSAFDTAEKISQEEFAAMWQNAQKSGVSNQEGYQRTKNGDILPVEVSIGMIELEGQNRMLVTTRDNTERYQARQKLLEERALLEQRVQVRTAELQRLNAELQIAARAKDDFLANMSHELRTPLNAVLGMSEMLGDELHGPLNERQLKYTKIINSSGQHLLDLINDILDLSKIEAGQRVLNLQPVLVEDLCRSSIYFTQQLAQKKNIQIQHENKSDTPVLHADPRSIKQIIVNLLSNAIKFSSEGSTIIFSVTDIPEKRAIQFTIKDYGIGIDPQKMPQLFKPFFQIDSSLSRKYEGTGLGLALVSRLVTMHGGSTILDSTGVPSEGSTFTVTLPINRQAGPPAVVERWKNRYEQHKLPTGRILLAEDDESTIQHLSAILNPLGFEDILIAHTGAELLKITRQSRPDRIILDMQVPDLDGWQILSILNTDTDLRDIPVFCLTSLFITGDEERYIKAGVEQYCCKPSCIDQMLGWLIEHTQIK